MHFMMRRSTAGPVLFAVLLSVFFMSMVSRMREPHDQPSATIRSVLELAADDGTTSPPILVVVGEGDERAHTVAAALVKLVRESVALDTHGALTAVTEEIVARQRPPDAPFAGFGFRASEVTDEERAIFVDVLQQLVQEDPSARYPVVFGDAPYHFSLLIPALRPVLPNNTVCVFAVGRDASAAFNENELAAAPRALQVVFWEKRILSALRGCAGRPIVTVNVDVLIARPADELRRLAADLAAVGFDVVEPAAVTAHATALADHISNGFFDSVRSITAPPGTPLARRVAALTDGLRNGAAAAWSAAWADHAADLMGDTMLREEYAQPSDHSFIYTLDDVDATASAALLPSLRASIQSVFFHHPTARVIVYSRVLTSEAFEDIIFEGYDLLLQGPDYAHILGETPVSGWWRDLTGQRYGEAHLSLLARFSLLYRHGGTLLPQPYVFVRPLTALPDCATASITYGHAEGGFIKLRRHHPAVEHVLSHYREDVRVDERPPAGLAASLLAAALERAPVRVLRDGAVMMLDRPGDNRCLSSFNGTSDGAAPETAALFNLILDRAFAVLLPRAAPKDSLCHTLANRFCVACGTEATRANDRDLLPTARGATADDALGAGGAYAHRLSVCTVVHPSPTPALYLPEWLHFHRIAGVDHFYVFDNSAAPGSLSAIMAPFVDIGVATVLRWSQHSNEANCADSDGRPDVQRCRRSAFSYCLANYREQSRWIAFLDLDEFLFSADPRISLPSALRPYEPFASVAVYTQPFGSNGRVVRPEGLVTESYLARAAMQYDGALDEVTLDRATWLSVQSVRSVVNPRRAACCDCGAHTFLPTSPSNTTAGLIVDEALRGVPAPVARNCAREPRVATRLRLAHYAAKSADEWMTARRAEAHDQSPSLETSQNGDHLTWRAVDRNEVDDAAAACFAPEIRRRMDMRRARDPRDRV